MKERLTGAIILVALIVLLVPELLTGPVRSSTVPQTAAASSEEPPLRSYTINLADDTRTARSTTSVGAAAAPDGADQPAPQANPSAVTESTDPVAVSGNAAGSGPTGSGASTAPGTPVASSGAVSGTAGSGTTSPAHPVTSDGRAAGDAAVPAASGDATAPAPSGSARTVTAPTSSGSATREHPRVPAPAAHGSGWMVQLGVFASRSNADRLAQELKGKGFRVSVSEIAGSSRALFRVRAGPVSDRTAASELAAKLRAAGAPGSVVPRS